MFLYTCFYQLFVRDIHIEYTKLSTFLVFITKLKMFVCLFWAAIQNNTAVISNRISFKVSSIHVHSSKSEVCLSFIMWETLYGNVLWSEVTGISIHFYILETHMQSVYISHTSPWTGTK